MTDKLAAVLPLLLVFGLLSSGSSAPWKKDAAQWTDQDAQTVLSTSPWAQSVNAEMHDPRDDDMEEYSPPPPAAERSGLAGQPNSNAPKGHWDGGPGRNRMGSLPSLPVVVRWDSALPVREALRHVSGSDPDASSPDYVITVTGLIPGGRYRSAGYAKASSNSDGSSDPRNPEELLEAFMSFSRLLPHDQPAIAPRNVRLDSKSGALHIFFPRSAAIEAKTKEIVFLTRFGSFKVRAKFRVKDMQYQGKLAL